MEATRGAPVYEAQGVGKRYGGVQALVDASLTLRQGEVHALLGANGAGKSTLVKILAGAAQPSAGTLRLRGEPVSFANAEQAAGAGIALVSQELQPLPGVDRAPQSLPHARALAGRRDGRSRRDAAPGA